MSDSSCARMRGRTSGRSRGRSPEALLAWALAASEETMEVPPFRARVWDLFVLAALVLWPFALAGAGLGALLWTA